MRHALVAFLFVLLGAPLLVACGPPAAPKTVSMRMKSDGAPPNASVTVDDQFVGTLEIVTSRGVALPPGKHHVTVESPGFLPWDKTVEVREGDAAIALDVKLVRVPD